MALNSFKKDGFLKRGNKFVLTLNCLGTFLLGVILAQSLTKKFLFSVEIARVILLSFAEMQFFDWIPKCCTIRTYFLGRRDLFKTLELLFLCSTLQMTRLSKESCLASQFFLFFGCDPSEFNWTFLNSSAFLCEKIFILSIFVGFCLANERSGKFLCKKLFIFIISLGFFIYLILELKHCAAKFPCDNLFVISIFFDSFDCHTCFFFLGSD